LNIRQEHYGRVCVDATLKFCAYGNKSIYVIANINIYEAKERSAMRKRGLIVRVCTFASEKRSLVRLPTRIHEYK
jgi:hypothetical protein